MKKESVVKLVLSGMFKNVSVFDPLSNPTVTLSFSGETTMEP